jgi:GH24 family phage-related lysozyme (muramidase)
MTMEDMFLKLYGIRQEFGWKSPEYQSTEARLRQAQASYLKDRTDITMFTNGVMPTMTDAEYNDAADAAYLSLGIMTPEQQLNTLSIFAKHGIEGKLRQRIQRMLRGTPEQRKEASVFVQSLRDSSKDGDYDDYLDTLPASKIKVEEYMSEAGLQPAEVDDAVAGITDKVDPWSYYDQMQTTVDSDGRGIGVQQGNRGSHNLAMEVWDDYNSALWGQRAPDFDELPPEVRRLAKDAVNLAAYQLRDRKWDEEDLKEAAKRILRGQLTYSHTVDDGMIPQQRTGSLMPRDTSKRDMKEMERHQSVFEGDAAAFNEENIDLPDAVATRKDDGYRLGRGELVIVDHGDASAPRPAYHVTGVATTLPEVMIPEAMRDLFASLDDSVEGVFHGYIAQGVDGQSIPMGNGMALVYNDKNASWEQRWTAAPPKDVSVSVEEIVGGTIVDPDNETILHTMGQVRSDVMRSQADRYLKAGIIDEETYNRIIEDMSGGKGNDAPPVSDEEFLNEMHDAITKAEYATFQKTSDRPGGSNGSLIESAGNFITKGEGVRTVAYDDYTGKSIVPGRIVKGNPTIGHGFNLNRKDAKKKLEAMGYDFNKVKTGYQRISEADGVKLRNMVIQEEMNWLSRKLKRNNVNTSILSNNQWAAMLSMSYNGRSLITKELIAALKGEDMNAAAEAIKEAKGGAWNRLPEGVRVGLKARRKKESNLFLGYS